MTALAYIQVQTGVLVQALLLHAQQVSICLALRACNVPLESTKPPRAPKNALPVPAHMGTGARPRLAALLFRPACARMERLAVVFSSSWIPLLQNVYANQNVMRENMVQQMIVFNVRS